MFHLDINFILKFFLSHAIIKHCVHTKLKNIMKYKLIEKFLYYDIKMSSEISYIHTRIYI